MQTQKKEQVDLVTINAEMGWRCDFRCEDCYRFFDCPSKLKYEMYGSVRMEMIKEKLSQVRNTVAVLSGKGGVGKSTISANLAIALAQRGYLTAILDSDFCGPSIPSILGIQRARLKSGPKGIVPPSGPFGIKVVSTALLLGDDDTVTWLSDLKTEALELFLANVDYGSLDYLIIDLPPGTGSETVNLLKLLPQITGTLIITTPSGVTEEVVRRCISLCRKARAPIIGLIENMSSFACPVCHEVYVPPYSAGDLLARETGIPLLGKIPYDPTITGASDKGKSFLLGHTASQAAMNFQKTVDRIEQKLGTKRQASKNRAESQREPNASQMPDILEINVDFSCYSKSCNRCSKYFTCTLERKKEASNEGMVRKIAETMKNVKHKIAIMSCKGGVGKSTVAANLAAALAKQGKATTVVDCDFHGPCIPRMLGVEGKTLKLGAKGIVPVSSSSGVGVLSMALLLQPDESVTWFDSLKKTTVEEFLSYVDYGELDYLIIDLPPGTGAESCAILQCIPNLDGIVIVTIPAQGPQGVVRRSVSLCRQANVPIIGIVENMSGFVCPSCGSISKMTGTKGGENLADRIGLPFLGEIPLECKVSESCDNGVPFAITHPELAAARSFLNIADKIRQFAENGNTKN